MASKSAFPLILAALLAGSACSSGGSNSPATSTRTAVSEGRLPKPLTVTPAEWGSEPLPFSEDYHHEPRRVLIHHSGVIWREGTNPYTRMKNLQTWGKRERDWMDVPYHFLIAPNGQVFEGRPVSVRPDTNTTFDTRGYVNVEVMGGFGDQRVSEPQLRSAVMITAWLHSEYGMNPDEILGHKDVAQTGCPGEDLYRYLGEGPFIGWVKEALEGREVEITPLPPLEQGPHDFVPDIRELWSRVD